MYKKQKQIAFKRGKRAETIAAWYLRFKGFHIAERRYKVKAGEVDIIARRGNLILVVEVKARKTLQEAMEAVSRMNEKRIENAADHWLAKQQDYAKLNIRYDLIAILPWKIPIHVPAFFKVQ